METVAIAGASGFIGQALLQELHNDYHVIALARSGPAEEKRENVQWRSCDLYSLLDAEKGLKGADYAIYLVHSMMPSARLTQGHFQDTDLILADNFAQAAQKNGVKQIIYLGGIIPSTGELSVHLQSRLEVEDTLASHGVPLTALRTSLIVGPGGSSFNILVRLVARLPMMICPKWTLSQTQPVSLVDVLAAMRFCLGCQEAFDKRMDLGGPDIMSYQEMMLRTAQILGKRRFLLTVPFFTARLSTLWVSLVSQSSYQLVAPLVQSLKHEMVARSSPLMEKMDLPQMSFEEAVKWSLECSDPLKMAKKKKKKKKKTQTPKNVRSVQRLPNPARKSALWVAKRYATWLSSFLRTLVVVHTDSEGNCRFFMRLFPRPLLELSFSESRSNPNRQLFYITGGVLAKTTDRGRLEFREILDKQYILVAIHDFEPTLPWYVYNLTQAYAHLWIMHSFAKYLESYGDD